MTDLSATRARSHVPQEAEQRSKYTMARGSRAALAAILCASAPFASTTVAFTAIPALNLPALQAKRAIGPTLREFKLALGEGAGAQAPEAISSQTTRRQALQHGVAAIGGIALTMSAGADAEELKGYKLVDIFRVSLHACKPAWGQCKNALARSALTRDPCACACA